LKHVEECKTGVDRPDCGFSQRTVARQVLSEKTELQKIKKKPERSGENTVGSEWGKVGV